MGTVRLIIGFSLTAVVAFATLVDLRNVYSKPAGSTGVASEYDAQMPSLDERYPNLTNLMRVTDRIYSGAQPTNNDAFAALVRLGVRTVISVDGIRPAVSVAEEFGLRYVHIPIGYDGISDAAGKSLTRVVREAEGPYFIHCHHGRHRGPAAAAVASIADGTIDGSNATAILERAGTSRQYAKLYRDVRNFTPPGRTEQLPELVSAAVVDTLTSQMARIDRIFEHLKLCSEIDWQSPNSHPDIVPSQEALLLEESFRELSRNEKVSKDYDDVFLRELSAAEEAATSLQRALISNDAVGAQAAYESMALQCAACHQAHRD